MHAQPPAQSLIREFVQKKAAHPAKSSAQAKFWGALASSSMIAILAQMAFAPTALAQTSAVNDRPENRKALFGDIHVHSKLSFDAYIFGVRATPDQGYRYAMGETIRHAAGHDLKLKGGALDFYAVTDHAEYLGVVPQLDNPDSPMSMLDFAKGMFSSALIDIAAAFQKVFVSVVSGKKIPEIYNEDITRTTWQQLQAAADQYYRPGKFTTFAGYEYTAQPEFGNLHRIVMFKGALRPDLPFGALQSVNPEDLWDWMDGLRAKGIDSIAIPHNSNVSDGKMFQTTDFAGNILTAQYAMQRMRNEPIVEISQVKGTSETHPLLSPNDEFANFEIYETLIGRSDKGKTDGSYVRQALLRGLEIERKTGKNPYKFGLIGSSDTHNSGGPVDEDHYFGKTGLYDGTPQARGALQFDNPIEYPESAVVTPLYEWSAAGLAGVWAEQNNREEIFAAMRRKEVFATSGTRIKARLFAGDYAMALINQQDYSRAAYLGGVPMGGHLRPRDGKPPLFLAHALKDANSAGLDRIQMVRGRLENGKMVETIYDIACAKGVPDPATHRCADSGARIDPSNCAIPANHGAAELKIAWRDPDYLAGAPAFYYLRVLENPTCRWSSWESLRLGLPVRKDIPMTIRERAWTSPIWVG